MEAAETARFADLRAQLSGRVVTPDDADWDAARAPFNRAVVQQPDAVALPADEDDVASAVRFAVRHGLRVAPQRTGHNAGPLGDLTGTLLLRTDAMSGVEVDGEARRARVRAGATWADVVPQASVLGLAALHGSAPTVGVVGYCLGGGMGWYARQWGLAANAVTAVEVVTADGSWLRADADHEPELFWAVRGGGGNYGVVTALEFDLYPVDEVYAGALFFPWERAREVLHAWHGQLGSLPDSVTSCARIMRFPPLPDIPELLRGQSFAVVEAACLAEEPEGAELLAPLRQLGPSLDTLTMMPPSGLVHLHMDPPQPVPALTGHQLLDPLAPAVLDALVEVAGPGSGSPLLSVELRHTGGALGRPEPHHGALAALPGELSMFAVGIPTDAAAAAGVAAHLSRITETLAPHAVGRALNLVEQPVDPDEVYPPDIYHRLRAVKSVYDPGEHIQANHRVPPADQ